MLGAETVRFSSNNHYWTKKRLEVKVILLINKGDVVNNLRAKMSGIDDCVVKAEGCEDLIRIIKDYIST